ncbi:polysaccharide lyase family 8 protein [Cyathus striatus]|nr:polysaccharide lyase family 8 protein [Cyathus striatus]
MKSLLALGTYILYGHSYLFPFSCASGTPSSSQDSIPLFSTLDTLSSLSTSSLVPESLSSSSTSHVSTIVSTVFTTLVGSDASSASTTEATEPLSTTRPTVLSTITTSVLGTAGTSLTATSALSAQTSSSTSISQTPIQTADPQTLQEIYTMQGRRLSFIIGGITRSPNDIPSWLSTLGPDGKWPDTEVDYTTGCAARRANWPAQEHWQRILVMAAAWHGGLEGDDQFVKNDQLRSSISLAMNYWFGRDFTNAACLDSGGTAACPCDNPDNSLWNTNWFSNIILIPELVGPTCLLLNDTLAPSEIANCTHITGRAYGTFDHNINGVGFLTGANTLDVAKIGIDQALLTVNVSMLTDAYRRVHLELQVQNSVEADGIRPDGSFGQHGGILYNGNYGKDYTNDLLDLELEAGGTEFAADVNSQIAFATLFDGDKWMIYRNILTGVLHWDFSVLGRFISFPVADEQATGSIKINLTEVGALGQLWSSSVLTNFDTSLSKNSTSSNAGGLVGNRMFYANDYMVHRGTKYVTTVKMFSSRTKNTECTNSQNPLGFHLADGVVYTYQRGDEYEDISAAWDWNLIPGITVDYEETPLDCDHTQYTGIESFVGGASTGEVGIAVMRYTNPYTQSLRWQKAWFFLEDDIQHVMVSNISSSSNASIFSVLDQRKLNGVVVMDGAEKRLSTNASAKSLWHDGIGYSFTEGNDAFTVSLEVGEKTGNWSAIGTSTQPSVTVDLFAAWLDHTSLNTSVGYTVFPGTTLNSFQEKSIRGQPTALINDGNISAVYHSSSNTVMIVFWSSSGGSVTFTPQQRGAAAITIASNDNIALIYRLDNNEITASDPSQALNGTELSISLGPGKKPAGWGSGRARNAVLEFPSGGLAGSSITQSIN